MRHAARRVSPVWQSARSCNLTKGLLDMVFFKIFFIFGKCRLFDVFLTPVALLNYIIAN
jgi:hypothetical protein